MQMPTSAPDDFHQPLLIHGEDGRADSMRNIRIIPLGSPTVMYGSPFEFRENTTLLHTCSPTFGTDNISIPKNATELKVILHRNEKTVDDGYENTDELRFNEIDRVVFSCF